MCVRVCVFCHVFVAKTLPHVHIYQGMKGARYFVGTDHLLGFLYLSCIWKLCICLECVTAVCSILSTYPVVVMTVFFMTCYFEFLYCFKYAWKLPTCI